MRKLLLSSVVLSVFAIALTVFQMSCQKEATAQQTGSNYTLPAATTSTLGGVIIGNGLNVTSNGIVSVTPVTSDGIKQLKKILIERYHDNSDNKIEYWTANYDGSNQVKIPIILPNGLEIGGTGARLTPDGQYLIFSVNGTRTNYIYRCKLDGSEMTKIIDSAPTDWYYTILGAY